MIEHLKEYLSCRFTKPLPGLRAQLPLEPAMSYGRHRGPAPSYARRASVMLLLHIGGDGISVPMVQRRDDLAFHPGEIGFPGGGLEEGESWEQAALRECFEETGITAEQVELFGILTPIYVFGSTNLVMPVLGIGRRPAEYRIDKSEIQKVIDVPLKSVRPDCVGTTERRLAGMFREVPCFFVDDAEIWGASAMILAELSALMSDFSR